MFNSNNIDSFFRRFEQFAITYILHLLNKPLIRATFTGPTCVKDDEKGFSFSRIDHAVTMKNFKWHYQYASKKKYGADLLVVVGATEVSILGIFF